MDFNNMIHRLVIKQHNNMAIQAICPLFLPCSFPFGSSEGVKLA